MDQIKLSEEYILYRRVKWKPDDADWWQQRGEWFAPQPVAVALGKTSDGLPRKHPDGSIIAGKAGLRERGLSMNAHRLPNGEAVRYAARGDLETNSVIGFYYREVRALGFEVEGDRTYPGHEAFEEADGPNDHHALVLTAADCRDPACDLLKPRARERLIGAAYVVDVVTGELGRKYYPAGYSV